MAWRSTTWPGCRGRSPWRTPHGSSACSTAGVTMRPDWPPCFSMWARRSTSRGWSLRMPTAWRGRGRSCAPARPGRPSNDCAARPALVCPDDAYHHALDHDVALVDPQRRHGGVRGLEPDPPARLTIEPLDRGARAVHQRDHRLAVVGLVALVDHRLTAYLQHVAAAAAGDQLVGHRDRVRAADRLDRRAGGHQAVQRQIGGAGLATRRHDLDAATLVVSAADVPLALEVGEMLVHRGEGAEREPFRDLLEARRVTLRADLGRDEVQDFALTACERHNVSRRETEAKSTRKSTERKHARNQA